MQIYKHKLGDTSITVKNRISKQTDLLKLSSFAYLLYKYNLRILPFRDGRPIGHKVGVHVWSLTVDVLKANSHKGDWVIVISLIRHFTDIIS